VERFAHARDLWPRGTLTLATGALLAFQADGTAATAADRRALLSLLRPSDP
jgi:hypothetical protein